MSSAALKCFSAALQLFGLVGGGAGVVVQTVIVGLLLRPVGCTPPATPCSCALGNRERRWRASRSRASGSRQQQGQRHGGLRRGRLGGGGAGAAGAGPFGQQRLDNQTADGEAQKPMIPLPIDPRQARRFLRFGQGRQAARIERLHRIGPLQRQVEAVGLGGDFLQEGLVQARFDHVALLILDERPGFPARRSRAAIPLPACRLRW